ncbi:MAG: hypothetical protein AB9869_08860 [Verrucomicrobiia bacterium]
MSFSWSTYRGHPITIRLWIIEANATYGRRLEGYNTYFTRI